MRRTDDQSLSLSYTIEKSTVPVLNEELILQVALDWFTKTKFLNIWMDNFLEYSTSFSNPVR